MNPLAPFRDRFVIDDPDLLYLDGNSLGRLPVAAVELAERLVAEQWGGRLIRGWNEGWMDLTTRIGDKVGRVIGSRPGEVVIADSTSVNLFKLASAAVQARPGRGVILTDDLNFPSDQHVLGSVAASTGASVRVVASPDGVHGPVEGLLAALDEDVALITLSGTAFQSGYTYDVGALTEAAHAVGALVLWDFSHTVGSVPIDVTGDGVDMAVGCSYKYLNGGPGAPAWMYVREGLADALDNPVRGWMGHADTFSFDPGWQPAPGVARFLTGTPPVVSAAIIEPGVDLILEAGVGALRTASLALTQRLLDAFDEELAPRGFSLGSPRDEHRGSHVTLLHPDGLAIDLALIAEERLIPDFRPPDSIRLGIAPLYIDADDVDEAVRRIVRVVDSGAHERHRNRSVGVT
ncbi:MAG: aminotransferase class V-fold PLP-dependent enzyme [Acidimicrobiia bacterium]|nr:aminotransferase class V-fold PLP-dependent enzyme [Acidimicrobiia bacterium]